MGMEQNKSGYAEKRRHTRINAVNVVDYVLFDKHRKKIDHGKGRTLNLSQSGALLETKRPLRGAYVLLISMDLDERKIQVKGRVANTRPHEKENCYLTGVEFVGSKDEQLNAIVAFVKAFHHRKHADQTADTSNPPEPEK